ncbi:unnamed protein product, partial [Onchocerca ochengi]|uniref:Syntaxin N-terminal domain-containing protein n=1 Tax=Onchocerca ochengi TaxID=42157 RepID=A0A182ER34_ONCOC
MPIDKTPLFRARVKMMQTQEAVRLKQLQTQKQQQQTENSLDNFDGNPLNLNFVSCTVEAQKIRQKLIAFRNMVISKRKNYVSDIGHSRRLIASYTDSMNDFERDELDAKIEEMMQVCIQSLQALKHKINSSNLRALDESPHLFEILRMLGKHLNGTAKIVAEMRALRTKKISNMRRTC